MSYTSSLAFHAPPSAQGKTVEIRDADGTALTFGNEQTQTTINSAVMVMSDIVLDDDYAGFLFVYDVDAEVNLTFAEVVPPMAPTTGSGPYTVTVHTGVAGSFVRLKQTDGAADMSDQADNSGDITFHVLPGHYALSAAASGYDSYSEEVVVDSENVETSFTLNQQESPSPSDPAKCRITGYAIDQRGVPIKGAKLTVTLNHDGPLAADGDLVFFRSGDYSSAADGKFDFELVRSDAFTGGSPTYTFQSEDGALEKTVSLETDTYSLGTLVLA